VLPAVAWCCCLLLLVVVVVVVVMVVAVIVVIVVACLEFVCVFVMEYNCCVLSLCVCVATNSGELFQNDDNNNNNNEDNSH
jgi:hypothetical protein